MLSLHAAKKPTLDGPSTIAEGVDYEYIAVTPYKAKSDLPFVELHT